MIDKLTIDKLEFHYDKATPREMMDNRVAFDSMICQKIDQMQDKINEIINHMEQGKGICDECEEPCKATHIRYGCPLYKPSQEVPEIRAILAKLIESVYFSTIDKPGKEISIKPFIDEAEQEFSKLMPRVPSEIEKILTTKIRTIKAKAEVILRSSTPPNATEEGLYKDTLELETAIHKLITKD